MCLEEPTTCGNVSISYPFYFSDKTRDISGSSNSYCGYPGLAIDYNYTVLDIIYDSHTIVLADTDALRGGSCPRVGHNAYEWLQYTGSPDNLTFFFGCKLNLAPPIDPGLVSVVDQYQINCKTFSNAPNGGGSFVFTSGELEARARVESELARRCSQVIVVPVNGSILNSSNQSALPSGGYGQEVVDDSSGCPRVDHNVTFAQGSWLLFPAGMPLDYLVFFLGCSFPNLFLPPENIDPITCSFIGLNGQSYVLPKDQVPPGSWSQFCLKIYEVPVVKYQSMDPKGDAWRKGGYGQVLRQGFP
uniref:Uncharacterized protein n=1 Tax=Oryza rufipogon TaxID=4529 RepID=A0A0E0N0U1_ORYRU